MTVLTPAPGPAYPQAQLDNAVRLACLLCDAPVAVLALADGAGEAACATQGWPAPEAFHESSFFTHVRQSAHPLYCPDLHADPRFQADRTAMENPDLRFFVGFPLADPSSPLHAVGALCLFDTKPRPSPPTKMLLTLELVAQQLMEAVSVWAKAHSKEQLFNRCLPLICHELNTPLNGIVGLSCLCNLPEGETIMKSAGVALRVLERLADFSQVQQGTLALDEAPFELRACVQQALRWAQPLLTHLAVRVQIDADCGPWVIGDQGRLKQVLQILLENASKYTATGEVFLKVSCCETADVEGKAEFLFEVHDTGAGITGDVASRLFKPFGLGDGSSTRAHGGTGLGLVIAQSICAAMGGRLWFTSEPGRGSCFAFTVRAAVEGGRAPTPDSFIPAAPFASLPDLDLEREVFPFEFAPDTPRAEDYKGLSVLIADDNKINQRVMAGFLQRLGCQPDIASTGVEILEAFAEKQYDLLLTDIEMPDMDGLEATRLLRAKGSCHAPYIVGVSANTLDSNRRACLEAGMQQFLPKPVRYDAVKQAVDGALRQKPAKRATHKSWLQRRLGLCTSPSGGNSPTATMSCPALQPLRFTRRHGSILPPEVVSPSGSVDLGVFVCKTPCPPTFQTSAKFSRLRGQ
eukprot:EG_transcript_4621